jgi:hypothetical protein
VTLGDLANAHPIEGHSMVFRVSGVWLVIHNSPIGCLPGIHEDRIPRAKNSPRLLHRWSRRGCRTGVCGTSRRCGGGFAEQVAGNVEKCVAATLLWERLEIRLDKNLDGLFAGINLDTNGRVAKVDLVPSSVRSSNDGVGHYRLAFRGRRRYQTTFDRSRPQKQSNYGLERCGPLDQRR